MNTYQIAPPVLEEYRSIILKDERVEFLKRQADEQLEEIAGNDEIYQRFLEKVNAPEKIDNVILWILLMSDESIVDEYIEEYDKDFTDMIPVCDLADLLFDTVYMKKNKDIELDGFDYLLGYNTPGMVEVDQHAVTNALAYIQKIKAAQETMQF
jgi:hypothetical protein